MAEVSFLPVDLITACIKRQTDTSARSFADGADLGARGPEIRTLGQSLAVLVETLRTALIDLDGYLADEIVCFTKHQMLGVFLADIERCAQLARAYDTIVHAT